MIIEEIHAIDFGAWHELTLDHLGNGTTVFYGPNEAGKTTLLNLIRTILYGFSSERCERYLPPASGTHAGGWLRVADHSGHFRIRRTAASNYRGGPGMLQVQADSDAPCGNELLTTMLAGVDETIFNNVFAIGLTQMQQLATLSDTEAANQLYGLATGVDRVSLFDVTEQLATQRLALLADDASEPGRIDALFETKARLQKEYKALCRDAGHVAKLRKEYRDLREQIERQQAAKEVLDRHGNWHETSAKIRDKWQRCLDLQRSLRRCGPVIEIPREVVRRLQASQKQVAQYRQQWLAVRDQRRQLQAEANKLKGQDVLFQHAAEIEALDRQADRMVGLETEVQRKRAAVEELEFEIQAELEELGLETGVSAKTLPALSEEVLEALREPAHETEELRRVVDSYQQMAEHQRRQVEETRNKLDVAAARFGGEPIEQALQRKFALVQNLERRVNLDEEREDIVRQLAEYEEDAHYWQTRTVLPWKWVLAAAAVFSVGAMMLLTGVLHEWFALADSMRTPMMTIGGALAVISLVIKGGFEHTAQERAEACRRQLQELHEEQTHAQRESRALDKTLPPGGGNLDQRLLDARQELSELDEFAPLQNRHRELQQETDALEDQTTRAVQQLKDARRTWKACLRSVGLPDSLTPAHIEKLTGRVGEIARLRDRALEAEGDLRDREQELAAIRDRIGQLLTSADIHDVFDSVAKQLARLINELGKHSKVGKQRQELRHQWEELKHQQDHWAKLAQDLFGKRRQLLQKHGLRTLQDFQRSRAKAVKAARMRAQRDELLSEIQAVLGDDFPVEQLAKSLENRDEQLLDHLQQLDRNRKTMDSDLAVMYERSGEIKQKLDGYLQDRRCERKDLEIRVVEEQIQVAFQSWRRAAMVSAVLERMKENYESKRQPVALAEASLHLERLTEGRYVRIWTPMGQNSLCVDDNRQQAMPVRQLSRGTRELVFLALRLALVGSYNRRGAQMPMVLDDVFVNFDDRRARAAAEVLADVAKTGQQLLVFTCHQRIHRIFADLDCDVRELPRRAGEGQPSMSEAQPSASEAKTAWATMEPIEPPLDAEPMGLPVGEERLEDDLVGSDPAMEPRSTPANIAPPMVPVEQFQPAWRDKHLKPLPDLSTPDS